MAMKGHELADKLYRLATEPTIGASLSSYVSDCVNALRDGAYEIKRLQSKLEERAMNEQELRVEALSQVVRIAGGSTIGHWTADDVVKRAQAFDAFLTGSTINRIDCWPRDDKNSRVDVEAATTALNDQRQTVYEELDRALQAHIDAEEKTVRADHRYKRCTTKIIQIEAGIKALGGKLEPIKKDFGRTEHREGGAVPSREANITAQGEQATDGCAQAPQSGNANCGLTVGPSASTASMGTALGQQAAPSRSHQVPAVSLMSHSMTAMICEDILVAATRKAGYVVTKERG